MSQPFFQFKQFTVWHDKCAMKVGTDGVLLGAWTPVESSARILDIGTGTNIKNTCRGLYRGPSSEQDTVCAYFHGTFIVPDSKLFKLKKRLAHLAKK